MQTICAWCGTTLGGEAEEEGRPLSHGICQACLGTLWNDVGVSTQDFLDSLGIPVLLVDGNVRVQGGTDSAPEVTGKSLEEMASRLGGQVFDCANSALPGGCGRTIHCSGCALRRTVTDTYESGRSHLRVPATLKVDAPDSPTAVAIYVTTEKLGDRVLLKIDRS